MFENREEAMKYIERKGFLILREKRISENVGCVEVLDRSMKRCSIVFKFCDEKDNTLKE